MRSFIVKAVGFVAVLGACAAVILSFVKHRAEERQACEARGGMLVLDENRQTVCIAARVLP